MTRGHSESLGLQRDDDTDDVRWALQTAAVQMNRGGVGDAVTWIHRAAEAAEKAGNEWRALELRAHARSLMVMRGAAVSTRNSSIPVDVTVEEVEIDELLEDEDLPTHPPPAPAVGSPFAPGQFAPGQVPPGHWPASAAREPVHNLVVPASKPQQNPFFAAPPQGPQPGSAGPGLVAYGGQLQPPPAAQYAPPGPPALPGQAAMPQRPGAPPPAPYQTGGYAPIPFAAPPPSSRSDFSEGASSVPPSHGGAQGRLPRGRRSPIPESTPSFSPGSLAQKTRIAFPAAGRLRQPSAPSLDYQASHSQSPAAPHEGFSASGVPRQTFSEVPSRRPMASAPDLEVNEVDFDDVGLDLASVVPGSLHLGRRPGSDRASFNDRLSSAQVETTSAEAVIAQLDSTLDARYSDLPPSQDLSHLFAEEEVLEENSDEDRLSDLTLDPGEFDSPGALPAVARTGFENESIGDGPSSSPSPSERAAYAASESVPAPSVPAASAPAWLTPSSPSSYRSPSTGPRSSNRPAEHDRPSERVSAEALSAGPFLPSPSSVRPLSVPPPPSGRVPASVPPPSGGLLGSVPPPPFGGPLGSVPPPPSGGAPASVPPVSAPPISAAPQSVTSFAPSVPPGGSTPAPPPFVRPSSPASARPTAIPSAQPLSESRSSMSSRAPAFPRRGSNPPPKSAGSNFPYNPGAASSPGGSGSESVLRFAQALTSSSPPLSARPSDTAPAPDSDDRSTLNPNAAPASQQVAAPVIPVAPAAAEFKSLVDGISLSETRGFEDLPVEVQSSLAGSVRVETLGEGEEVAFFGAAIVTFGAVDILPAISDEAGAVAHQGEVVFTLGTLPDSMPLRVVAKLQGTRVAVWDPTTLNQAIAECPWVHDELHNIADRFLARCGATLGALGERLDDSLRGSVYSRLEVRAYHPGEVLAKAGEAVPRLFIIGGGRVELIDAAGAVCGELTSGDFLFPSSIVSASRAPHTARAGASGALVLQAPRGVAHELMMSVPPLLEILAC